MFDITSEPAGLYFNADNAPELVLYYTPCDANDGDGPVHVLQNGSCTEIHQDELAIYNEVNNEWERRGGDTGEDSTGTFVEIPLDHFSRWQKLRFRKAARRLNLRPLRFQEWRGMTIFKSIRFL